ncbi:phage shock protein PspA [Nitrospirillum sp. BR 11163]|uniref:phage shock protein PspA n=1 Tax=Nitrospirillum sp. BR 11163 TaxID=3104323 RepID=UPI002AFEA55F|nr:phage shock protein PspA [Nitrospirillum sp. BR 11163]MEA1676987.1 phage shock protein PspA [Nitrospirillum sp. BR 11163]
MGLFSRLGDIIDANLNAMLDRAEDPERLIGLVIQEMEDTLVEVRAEAVRSMARRKELEARYRDVEFELLEWDRKAELAVTKGREDLARGALVAKARLADAADPIRREIQAISDSLAKGADDVARLEAKLADARARQGSLMARHRSATARLRMRSQIHDHRLEEALSHYGTLERDIDLLESEAEVMEMGRQPRGLAAEIDALGDDKVTAELEALKARVAGRANPQT